MRVYWREKPPCLKNMFERNVQITQQLSLLMVDILCHAPHIRSDHKHTSLERFMDDQRAILQPNRGNYDRIDLIEDLKTALVVSGGFFIHATTALSIAHAAENATYDWTCQVTLSTISSLQYSPHHSKFPSQLGKRRSARRFNASLHQKVAKIE